jgi:hypothetical protein
LGSVERAPLNDANPHPIDLFSWQRSRFNDLAGNVGGSIDRWAASFAPSTCPAASAAAGP